VPLLCEQLALVLPALAREFEVVLVNDGSRDGSWGAIVALGARYPWVRGINLMRNYGQHNALLCAIRVARYDVLVTMDDDLQHPPEEIPRLLERLAEGCDAVYGTPAAQQHGLLRDMASTITKRVLQGAMGAETASKVSAFRAFRREVCPAFTSYQSSFVSIDVLLTWGTRRFSAVTVRHDPRRLGESNYTIAKLVRHALNMVTGFSTAPLQFASVVGFVFTLFGIAVLGFVLARYLVDGGSIPGFPFLASVVAIFSGAQLFAIGVIGEYLARMHARSMGHPTYVVREVVNVPPVTAGDGRVHAGAAG
jgi:undecaprenyl-phosphate 4-deoxy-4-formamido-L-arabinose transferase